MPPNLPNEQQLNLKKRARRRLVGAVALVLLMVIILPRILQDRAVLAPQETIKITMPEVNPSRNVEAIVGVIDSKMENNQVPQANSSATDEQIKTEATVNSEIASEIKAENTAPKDDTVKNAEVKAAEIKDVKATAKVTELAAGETKSSQINEGNFAIQVGVYSDSLNVKQLQAKLDKIGYKSRTEKVTTVKGEKIRLKTGNFTSRQEAISALAKLQEAGLPGMVVSN